MAKSISLTGDSTSVGYRISRTQGHMAGDDNILPSSPHVSLYGDFNGSTVVIQWAATDTAAAYVNITDASYTAAAHDVLDFDTGFIRFVMSGSTSPSPNVTVEIV